MNIMVDPSQVLRQVRLALQNENFQTAIYWLEQAVNSASRDGDHSAEGRHMGNLALVHYRLGQRERALECFQVALASAREDSDLVTEEGLLGNIGNIMREIGRFGDAISYLTQALAISHEIDDRRGRGIWLGNLGLVYDDIDQPDQAIPLHQQAIEIARMIYDKRGLAARLGHLGNSCVSLGDYQLALTAFIESAQAHRELGDHAVLAQRLGVIGNLYGKLARASDNSYVRRELLEKALSHYVETLVLARTVNDQHSQAELLRAIGGISADLGAYTAALGYLRDAAKLYRQLGMNDQAQVIASMRAALADAASSADASASGEEEN